MSESTSTPKEAPTMKKTVFIPRAILGGTKPVAKPSESVETKEAPSPTEKPSSKTSPSGNSTPPAAATTAAATSTTATTATTPATSAAAKAKAAKVSAAKNAKAKKGANHGHSHGGEACHGHGDAVDAEDPSELGLSLEEQQKLLDLGRWLCSKDSKVRSVDATLIGERRGHIFEGRELTGAILAANPKKYPVTAPYSKSTGAEVSQVLSTMRRLGFFSAVEAIPPRTKMSHAKTIAALPHQDALDFIFGEGGKFEKEKDADIKVRKAVAVEEEEETKVEATGEEEYESMSKIISDGDKFDEDCLYIWNIESNSKALLFQSVFIVAFIIAMCCVKIWPIWLRIVVYYLSLSLLILMLSATVLHLVSGPIFFLIGFRKTYFLPNIFDEDVGLLETFTPIVGRGGEHQARWKAEREAARRKALGLPEETASQPTTGLAWQLGFLNVIFLLGLGVLGASYLGVFSPENIPEFVVSSHDFFSFFPSLATPEMAAKAAEAAEAAETVFQAAADAAADAADDFDF